MTPTESRCHEACGHPSSSQPLPISLCSPPGLQQQRAAPPLLHAHQPREHGEQAAAATLQPAGAAGHPVGLFPCILF